MLSAGIWLIHNLSQTYVNLVSVPVVAESNLPGHAGQSSSDATISAMVRGSGFRQAGLSRRHRRPERVVFNAADFRQEGDNLFVIPVPKLYEYASAIFGEGISVESFVSEAPRFVFQEVGYKKVPVRKVQALTFESQYMPLHPMRISPDSVLVYGEASRLENIEQVLTRPIDLWGLRSSVHGSVKLEIPSGVRLSDTEVAYSMDVVRYVETSSQVEIQTRNVPRGQELVVLPPKAEVVFKTVFPVGTDPARKAVFYVDYNDFAGSITGRCVPYVEGLPSGVISWKMSPETFDCIERTSAQ